MRGHARSRCTPKGCRGMGLAVAIAAVIFLILVWKIWTSPCYACHHPQHVGIVCGVLEDKAPGGPRCACNKDR